MTAAFNLSQLANNLNTSGQLDATDGLTGAVPVANGGTGSNTAAGARSNLGTNDAANITTGTIATARLGSGTANSTTFLRGDQTWATASGGVTSLNGQTGAITNTNHGSIGSYTLAFSPSLNAGNSIQAGSTYAASSLTTFADNTDIAVGAFNLSSASSSTGLSGTWRIMHRVRNQSIESIRCGALWVRIS